ncbi:transposase, partial [Thiocapsa sp.]|uniref:transposase n=1 Tax=Thiocapsa sp. TaxID=2024551 RepID=UPI00359369F6
MIFRGSFFQEMPPSLLTRTAASVKKPGTDHGFLLSSRHLYPEIQQQIGMPRHARIVAAGFPMHVILRGIDRTTIFFAEGDYRVFSDILAALAESESVRVHAYVLMTNHVHLLMTPATDR